MDFKKYKKGIQVSKQGMLCLLGEGTLFFHPVIIIILICTYLIHHEFNYNIFAYIKF